MKSTHLCPRGKKRAELQSYLLSDSKSWHAFDGLFCATSRVIFCEEASKQTLLSWGQEMMMMRPCCLVLLQQSIIVLRVVLPHPFSCVGTKDWWMPEWLLTPLKNTCCQLLATQLNFLVLTVANNSKGAKLSSRIEYVFISLLSSNMIKGVGYLESNKCIREKKAAAVLQS